MLFTIQYMNMKDTFMKTLFYTLTISALLTGCADLTFQPEGEAPATAVNPDVVEHQKALTEQDDSVQNR